jgi:hypothetical protein
MHALVFCLFGIKIGSLLSCGLAALTVTVVHLGGRLDTYYYGVWTMPNALVLDLGLSVVTICTVVWTLLGSIFIICLRLPKTSTWHIAPYMLPKFLKDLGRNLSYTLQHSPIVTTGPKGQTKWSFRAFHLMISKTLLVALGTFAFIVMPTCTIVTVYREQWLTTLAPKFKDIKERLPIPLTCGEMFPDMAKAWKELDEQHLETQPVIFESLCWEYSKIFSFVTIFGAVFGALVSALALVTVAVQYGRNRD